MKLVTLKYLLKKEGDTGNPRYVCALTDNYLLDKETDFNIFK